MPKFNKQNKKRINPKYFLDEMLEEAVLKPPEETFPGVSPADKASDLAKRAMQQQASGQIPPWQPQKQYSAPSGPSVTDEDVIRSIYNLLKGNQSSGYRELSGRFMEMMKERGVISQEAGDKIDQGYKARSARMAGFDDGT